VILKKIYYIIIKTVQQQYIDILIMNFDGNRITIKMRMKKKTYSHYMYIYL